MASVRGGVPADYAVDRGAARLGMASEPFRLRLADRLLDLLLVHLLIHQPWFRRVLGLFLLLGLALAVSFPKMWVTTPPDLNPPVKISLIDMVQAWSLSRSAANLAAQGKHDEAAKTWQAAVVNNLGNPNLLRGALHHLAQSDLSAAQGANFTLFHARYLLALTGTNRADVALAAQVCDRFEVSEGVLSLLGPLEGWLTPTEEATYLKALFREGQWSQFDARWERVRDQVRHDRELALFRAAYVAGWGPPETMRSGMDKLVAAQKDPRFRVLASRLRLLVYAQLLEPQEYEVSLARLKRLGQDRVADHIGFWLLLRTVGRSDEARDLARNFLRPPETGTELLRLSQALSLLGLKPAAFRVLRDRILTLGVPGLPGAARSWAFYTELLAENGDWAQLRPLALRLRSLDQGRCYLTGFSFYMAGRAEYGMGHYEQALIEFQQAATALWPDPELALDVAVRLLRMGYLAEAKQILATHEPNLTTEPQFWLAQFEIAYGLRQDAARLLKTAAKALELLPADPRAKNLYAVALLVNRRFPEQAARLTEQLLARSPTSTAARINHSLALTQARQFDQAAALLGRLDVDRLKDREAASYYLNWFEIHWHQQQFDRARQDLERLDEAWLFPDQTAWLAGKRAQLPPIDAP
ncbi:MAG: hypothetical protein FJ387_00495 [Verrucomicrobia bacterium]|nr:hypothetical protein [Verrucomicrobiota bacterium]